MNKKCKLPITFLLWDRLITSDNNLRQFYTIFLYQWTILPEDSSFFFSGALVREARLRSTMGKKMW